MRRRAVLAVVLLVSATVTGVVGYRLADSGGTDVRQSAHEIDFSDPPGEIAYDALAQTGERDYTVESLVDRELAGAVKQENGLFLVFRGRIEQTDGQAYFESFVGPDEFANEHCRWFQKGTTERLNRHPMDCGYDERLELTELYIRHGEWTAVRQPGANVSIVAEKRTTLVLRVNDTDTAHFLESGERNVTDSGRDIRYRANLTLYVDKDDGHLRRFVFAKSYLPNGNESRERERFRYVYVYSDWGNTTVERPDGAGYTLAEFLLDVLRPNR